MPQLEVPVIGIGAGLATDGQVLVFHDLLGINTGPHSPRFVKRYAEIHDRMVEGVRAYAEEVRARRFPDAEHVYSVDPAEVEELKRYLDSESLDHGALGLVGAPSRTTRSTGAEDACSAREIRGNQRALSGVSLVTIRTKGADPFSGGKANGDAEETGAAGPVLRHPAAPSTGASSESPTETPTCSPRSSGPARC